MNIDFKASAHTILTILQSQTDIAIVIKGSPDPDAMASSYFFLKLCHNLNIKASIFASKPPSLPSNKEIVSIFNIPLTIVSDIKNIAFQRFSGYIVCDFQTAAIEGVYTCPCIIHLDHHAPAEIDIKAQFRMLTDKVSSTSTLCALLMQHLPSLKKDAAVVGTALYIGIKTDSDIFRHLHEYDREALEYLQPHCDFSLIEKIENVPLSPYALDLLKKAMRSAVPYKDWLIVGIGFVDEKYRDTIAIIADYLLSNNDAALVVVYGAVYHDSHGKLDIDASFRTKNEEFDLDGLIKNITADGGGRKFKGAYQVHIDYFVHCPDKDTLWNVIELTTNQILMDYRDARFRIGMQSKYKKIKRVLKQVFSRQQEH